jgi:hypothetical protein
MSLLQAESPIIASRPEVKPGSRRRSLSLQILRATTVMSMIWIENDRPRERSGFDGFRRVIPGLWQKVANHDRQKKKLRFGGIFRRVSGSCGWSRSQLPSTGIIPWKLVSSPLHRYKLPFHSFKLPFHSQKLSLHPYKSPYIGRTPPWPLFHSHSPSTLSTFFHP